MTVLRVVTIVCDAEPMCENEYSANTVRDARAEAGNLGWVQTGRPLRDYCPEHSYQAAS